MRPLLEVRDLIKRFPASGTRWFARGRGIPVVDGLSFDVAPGETLGVVGESGCGKSTLARMLVRLLRPTAGAVLFEGRDVFGLRGRELKEFRRQAQIVFQDPYSSLDPRMTVSATVAEPLAIHRLGTRAERFERVVELLESVGLHSGHARRYPHELSGGQRQRIALARALALGPRLLICDEPVSALDACVRAQVMELLGRMQRESGMSYVFIAHDLEVVRRLADRVAVMYLGRVVETAPRDALFGSPGHPYTQALLSAVPHPDPERERRRERIVLPDLPSAAAADRDGCVFRDRCPIARTECAERSPDLGRVGDGHDVACHFPGALPLRTCTPPRTMDLQA